MLEAYTTLGYLAAVTRTIKLGPMVGGVVFRAARPAGEDSHNPRCPVWWALYFAVGSAWYEGEARALGVPGQRVRNGSRCSRRHCR